nr:MAG TPA: hypothetical protein [Caudoviricetes sp.]
MPKRPFPGVRVEWPRHAEDGRPNTITNEKE